MGFKILQATSQTARTVGAGGSETFPDQSVSDPDQLLEKGDEGKMRIAGDFTASAGYTVEVVREVTERDGNTATYVVATFTPSDNQTDDDSAPAFVVDAPQLKNKTYIRISDTDSSSFDVTELVAEWEE